MPLLSHTDLRKFKKLQFDETEEIITLLSIILKYNYFSFNGQLFQQTEGLAMGDCLSGFLADVFINHFEVSFFFQPSLVQKLSTDKTNKNTIMSLLNKNGPTAKKYFPISFVGDSSYRIARLFSKYDLNIVFTTNNLTNYLFIHNERPLTDKYLKSGIYKIQCSVCQSFYVGQTRRAFETRFREHLLNKDCENAYKSTFAEHLKVEKHLQPPTALFAQYGNLSHSG